MKEYHIKKYKTVHIDDRHLFISLQWNHIQKGTLDIFTLVHRPFFGDFRNKQ